MACSHPAERLKFHSKWLYHQWFGSNPSKSWARLVQTCPLVCLVHFWIFLGRSTYVPICTNDDSADGSPWCCRFRVVEVPACSPALWLVVQECEGQVPLGNWSQSLYRRCSFLSWTCQNLSKAGAVIKSIYTFAQYTVNDMSIHINIDSCRIITCHILSHHDISPHIVNIKSLALQ